MLDKYDLDGDGKLDAAEQQNIGHDMLRMEDMAKMLKKGLIFVVCTAVGLMISNIGTVYFVVWLTKDVKIASDGVMKNMDGGNVKTEVCTNVFNGFSHFIKFRMDAQSIIFCDG